MSKRKKISEIKQNLFRSKEREREIQLKDKFKTAMNLLKTLNMLNMRNAQGVMLICRQIVEYY